MFKLKIIKESTLKEMEYTASLYKLENETLVSNNGKLTFRVGILSDVNKSQGKIIESLRKEIESLTPTRDFKGRYAKKKKINGSKN